MNWLLASQISRNIVGGPYLETTDTGLFTIFDTLSNPSALLKRLLFPALPLVYPKLPRGENYSTPKL